MKFLGRMKRAFLRWLDPAPERCQETMSGQHYWDRPTLALGRKVQQCGACRRRRYVRVN